MITEKSKEETTEVFNGLDLPEGMQPEKEPEESERYSEELDEAPQGPQGLNANRPEGLHEVKPTAYLSAHDIEHLKHQFGDKLYMFAIDENRAFIIRPIKRSEYIALTNQCSQGAFTNLKEEEELVKRCLCWPKETTNIEHWGDLEAGVATFLASYVKFVSGFITIEQAYAYNMLAEL